MIVMYVKLIPNIYLWPIALTLDNNSELKKFSWNIPTSYDVVLLTKFQWGQNYAYIS